MSSDGSDFRLPFSSIGAQKSYSGSKLISCHACRATRGSTCNPGPISMRMVPFEPPRCDLAVYEDKGTNFTTRRDESRTILRVTRETACSRAWSTPTRRNSRIATTRRHHPRYMLPDSTWQSTQTPLSVLVCVFSGAPSPPDVSCSSHTCTPPRDTERQVTDSPNLATA